MKINDIEIFEKLHLQIKDIYTELSVLSKKSPDGQINKFKLKFVNQLLEQANRFLAEKYEPFNDFTLFQENNMPSNSDVVFVVSQYIKCLEKFKYDNIQCLSGKWFWIITDKKEQIKTSAPILELTR